MISLVEKTQGLIKNREMAAHVEEKGLADYVTQVDIAVQNFLKKELFALAPDIQFLGEETGLQEIKADCFWILDPVDGTTNLMHDYQHSVVSLALCRQEEIVMGIVYDPFHEEVFSAIKGQGSFLNGKPIHVSNAEKLSDTIIGLGTAKREFAYTACGRQGGYFETYLHPWDYAAGMLLIQEAGGKITDFTGRALNPRTDSSVVGTNGYIHSELLHLL